MERDVPWAVANYRQGIHRSDIDAVSVRTTATVYPAVAIVAAQAGKHALREKPSPSAL
jgi:predicted dehydrogenase